MKFFSAIVDGLKWVGKEILQVPNWIDKAVKLIRDGEQDAETLAPQLIVLLADGEAFASAAVKDGGAVLTAIEKLVAAVAVAYVSKGANIAADLTVAQLLEDLAKEAASSSTWSDVLAAIKTFVKDFDEFGASAKAALEKLEADAKS